MPRQSLRKTHGEAIECVFTNPTGLAYKLCMQLI